MPSNSTWVCFDCRSASRTRAICAQCGKARTNIGYKIAIPRKSNIRAWNALHAMIRERRISGVAKLFESKVKQRHELERQIVKLQALPTSDGRRRSVKLLRKKLISIDTRAEELFRRGFL